MNPPRITLEEWVTVCMFLNSRGQVRENELRAQLDMLPAGFFSALALLRYCPGSS